MLGARGAPGPAGASGLLSIRRVSADSDTVSCRADEAVVGCFGLEGCSNGHPTDLRTCKSLCGFVKGYGYKKAYKKKTLAICARSYKGHYRG